MTPPDRPRPCAPAATRRRESEKSLENEPLAREDEAPSPTARPQEEKQPLKAVPAPPPKENAWVKRSTNPPARPPGSDSEQHSPPRWVSLRTPPEHRGGLLGAPRIPTQPQGIVSPPGWPWCPPRGADGHILPPRSSQTAPGLPLEDGVAPRSAPRKGEAGGGRTTPPQQCPGICPLGGGTSSPAEGRW